jgi:hypothetical protein
LKEIFKMAKPKVTFPPIVSSEFTLNPASIPASTSAVQTVTVKGLRIGFPVMVWAASLEANLAISNAYCSAKDTLKFTLTNPTVSAVDPASQAFKVVQF